MSRVVDLDKIAPEDMARLDALRKQRQQIANEMQTIEARLWDVLKARKAIDEDVLWAEVAGHHFAIFRPEVKD